MLHGSPVLSEVEGFTSLRVRLMPKTLFLAEILLITDPHGGEPTMLVIQSPFGLKISG